MHINRIELISCIFQVANSWRFGEEQEGWLYTPALLKYSSMGIHFWILFEKECRLYRPLIETCSLYSQSIKGTYLLGLLKIMFCFGLAKFKRKKAEQTNPQRVKHVESVKLKGLQSPTTMHTIHGLCQKSRVTHGSSKNMLLVLARNR